MSQCAQTSTGSDGIVSLLSHPRERAWSCLCPSHVLALKSKTSADYKDLCYHYLAFGRLLSAFLVHFPGRRSSPGL